MGKKKKREIKSANTPFIKRVTRVAKAQRFIRTHTHQPSTHINSLILQALVYIEAEIYSHVSNGL